MRRSHAFTLLEMVAVLVLILVLAGLAIPTYQAVIGESRQDAAVLSAQAYRDSIDAYAATQQLAPNQLSASTFQPSGTLAAELPSNATSTVTAGVVTVRLEFGSDDRCATITLASSVGGSSTVAAVNCPAEAVAAPASTFQLVSTMITGTGPGLSNASYLSSHGDSLSTNGRWLLWHTRESLDPADTNTNYDLYMSDLETGQTTLISRSASGVAGDADSWHGSFGASDRWIYFSSEASNLTDDLKAAGVSGAFAFDRDSDNDGIFDESGATSMVLLSLTDADTVPDGGVDGPSPADNDRYVAVRAAATDLDTAGSDTNAVSDVYVLDRDSDNDGIFDEDGTRVWARVSYTSTGVQMTVEASTPKMFPDGTRVAFSTASTLVAADVNATADAYVVDVGSLAVSLVSTAADMSAAGGVSWVNVSTGGGFVSYTSASSTIVAGDTNGVTDVFLYNMVSGITTRVTAVDGVEVNGNANFSRVVEYAGEVLVAYRSSDTALMPGSDDAGTWDVFVWSSVDDGISGTVERITTSTTGWYSYGTSISDDGRVVGIQASMPLDPADVNAASDIYVYYRS